MTTLGGLCSSCAQLRCFDIVEAWQAFALDYNILEVYWDNGKEMEKNMETTIIGFRGLGLGFCVYLKHNFTGFVDLKHTSRGTSKFPSTRQRRFNETPACNLFIRILESARHTLVGKMSALLHLGRRRAKSNKIPTKELRSPAVSSEKDMRCLVD